MEAFLPGGLVAVWREMDRDSPGQTTSYGNAAAAAFTEDVRASCAWKRQQTQVKVGKGIFKKRKVVSVQFH